MSLTLLSFVGARKNPISEGIRRRDSIEKLRAQILRSPRQIRVKESDTGRLPLHYAACCKAPVELVRELLREWPEALLAKDNDGCVPLHLAVRNRAKLEVVRLLTEADQRALLESDNRDDLPVHIAANLRRWDVVNYLADKEPETLKEKNKDGALPLHLAVANGAKLNVIQYLVQAERKALEEGDNEGRLPLHLASEYAGPKVIEYMANEWSEALQERNNEGCLPLHFAAEHATQETVELFAKRRSDSLRVVNRKGERPIDVARISGRLDIVTFLEAAMNESRSSSKTLLDPSASSCADEGRPDSSLTRSPLDVAATLGYTAWTKNSLLGAFLMIAGATCNLVIKTRTKGSVGLLIALFAIVLGLKAMRKWSMRQGQTRAATPAASVSSHLDSIAQGSKLNRSTGTNTSSERIADEQRKENSVRDSVSQDSSLSHSNGTIKSNERIANAQRNMFAKAVPKTQDQLLEERKITNPGSWIWNMLRFWKDPEKLYMCNVRNKHPSLAVLVVAVPKDQKDTVQEVRDRSLGLNASATGGGGNVTYKTEEKFAKYTGRVSHGFVGPNDEFQLSVTSDPVVHVYLLFPSSSGGGLYYMLESTKLNVKTSNLHVWGSSALQGTPLVEVIFNASGAVTIQTPMLAPVLTREITAGGTSKFYSWRERRGQNSMRNFFGRRPGGEGDTKTNRPTNIAGGGRPIAE